MNAPSLSSRPNIRNEFFAFGWCARTRAFHMKHLHPTIQQLIHGCYALRCASHFSKSKVNCDCAWRFTARARILTIFSEIHSFSVLALPFFLFFFFFWNNRIYENEISKFVWILRYRRRTNPIKLQLKSNFGQFFLQFRFFVVVDLDLVSYHYLISGYHPHIYRRHHHICHISQ